MMIATEPTLRAAADAHREPFIFGREITDFLRKSLAREYKNFGKPLLLAARGETGVYPAEAHWLLPKGFETRAWMDRHLAPLIAISNLFPAPVENIFFHAGKIGDIIAALPVIRQLGGGRLVIGDHPRAVHMLPMRGDPYESLRPLLLAQPYITGVEYSDNYSDATHELATFRHGHRRGESLAQWQARHLNLVGELNLAPWLSVPKVEPNLSVVIARSLRYHNRFFPWPELVHKFHKELVFVGLPIEHASMEQICGRKIPYQPTKDLLELAHLIAGANLFIGNQSAPFWIAAGLGVPIIQESWETDPNSVVPRENARYTLTGPETRTLIYRL